MSRLQKILFVTHNFPPIEGGISTFTYEIAAGIARLGTDVRILAPVCNPIHLPSGIKLVSFSEKKIFKKFRRLAIILPLLSELTRKPDVVFLTSLHPYGLIVEILCALLRRPYILATHGSEIIRILSGHNWMKVEAWAARKSIKHATSVFAISNYTAELDLRLLARERDIHVIPNGVNIEQFKPSSKKISTLNKWIQVDHDHPFVMLTVSTLTRRKGQIQIIKAMELLKEKYPQIVYIIVGDGPERSNLENEVQRGKLKDQVYFLGLVPYIEVLEFYHNANLFILTSRLIVDHPIEGIEGFGIVFLEANACGLPVIGSRVGGIPDVVKEGETGLLVDPENPAEIADAIEILMNDEALRNRLGQNGIQWAREHDWSLIVPKYLEVLEKIVP